VLYEAKANHYDAICGAAHGIMEGAIETGCKLEETAVEAIAGAKEIAHDLNLNVDKAVMQTKKGILEVTDKLDEKTADQIKKVISAVKEN
jgi:hypothetical protein